MDKAEGSCLPVGNVAFDHSVYNTGDISELSAEQYMTWVRHQADSMPTVFRADVNTAVFEGRQTRYMPQVDGIEACPGGYGPDPEWASTVLYEFSEMRGVLGRLALRDKDKERRVAVPPMKDRAAWHLFCLGVEEEAEEGEEEEDGGMGDQPGDGGEGEEDGDEEEGEVEIEGEGGAENGAGEGDSAAIAAAKRLLAQQMGLEDGDPPVPTAPAAAAPPKWAGQVNVAPTLTLLLQFDHVLIQRLLATHTDWLCARDLTLPRAQWLYCLLARLEKPLYQDAAAVVRQLYRRCCELRAALSTEAGTFAQDLAALNVLVCIAGAYFGQGEGHAMPLPTPVSMYAPMPMPMSMPLGGAARADDEMEDGEVEEGEEPEEGEIEEGT